MKNLLFTACILQFFSCSYYTYKPIQQENVCVSKVKYEAITSVSSKKILVYHGDIVDDPGIKDTILAIGPKVKKWEKRLRKENCNSPNPEDCMVWCLCEVNEEVPAKILTPGSTISDNVTPHYIEVVDTIRPASIEYIETLCPDQLSPTVIEQLTSKMVEYGYLSKVSKKPKLTASLLRAVRAYQQDRFIGIGLISVETMDYLGIGY